MATIQGSVYDTGSTVYTGGATWTISPNTALWGQCVTVFNAPAVESNGNKKLLLLEEGL